MERFARNDLNALDGTKRFENEMERFGDGTKLFVNETKRFGNGTKRFENATLLRCSSAVQGLYITYKKVGWPVYETNARGIDSGIFNIDLLFKSDMNMIKILWKVWDNIRAFQILPTGEKKLYNGELSTYYNQSTRLHNVW